jgi:hypothetical protein
MLVRTADARYQAVRLRARLVASKARKALQEALQGSARAIFKAHEDNKALELSIY